MSTVDAAKVKRTAKPLTESRKTYRLIERYTFAVATMLMGMFGMSIGIGTLMAADHGVAFLAVDQSAKAASRGNAIFAISISAALFVGGIVWGAILDSKLKRRLKEAYKE